MNICVIANSYHPIVGGAETYIRSVAEGMKANGHNVVVFTDFVDGEAEFEVISGVHVYRAKSYLDTLVDRTKVRWEQLQFSLLKNFSDLFSAMQFDIIHANGLDSAIWGSMIATTLNIPLVCTYHEQAPENDPYGYGKCKVAFSAIPVDAYIAGSKFYYEKALEHGAERSRVHLIYHGIDLKRFSEVKSSASKLHFGIRDEAPLIVAAARLKERKGLRELIESISLVKTKISEIQCIIVGSRNSSSQEYADLLYDDINRLGLVNTVQIIETATLDQMPSIYSMADIVVHPSHAEGLGLAVLEAMAMQKPVITTAVTGIQEISSEKWAEFVPPRSPNSIANAIELLLSNDELRYKLAKRGKSIVDERFNFDITLRKTAALYEELLETREQV